MDSYHELFESMATIAGALWAISFVIAQLIFDRVRENAVSDVRATRYILVALVTGVLWLNGMILALICLSPVPMLANPQSLWYAVFTGALFLASPFLWFALDERRLRDLIEQIFALRLPSVIYVAYVSIMVATLAYGNTEMHDVYFVSFDARSHYFKNLPHLAWMTLFFIATGCAYTLIASLIFFLQASGAPLFAKEDASPKPPRFSFISPGVVTVMGHLLRWTGLFFIGGQIFLNVPAGIRVHLPYEAYITIGWIGWLFATYALVYLREIHADRLITGTTVILMIVAFSQAAFLTYFLHTKDDWLVVDILVGTLYVIVGEKLIRSRLVKAPASISQPQAKGSN